LIEKVHSLRRNESQLSSMFLVSYLTRVGENVDYDLETFFEATEDWNSAMTLSNSMAFISQFGEVCLSSENVMKSYNN